MNVRRARAGLVALLAITAALVAAATASTATTSKPYTLVIAPGTPSYESATGEVASGETVGITATFTNQTATQQIGSANLFWPAGFSVVPGSPSVTPSGTASVANSCAYLGAPGGPCVQLRSLAVPPGGSVTVTMSVTTPVGEAGSDHPWKAEVKQANNYSGSPGNDLFFNGGNVDTTLDGATSLQFGVEPADARTNQVITGTPYNVPPGSALTVTVLGANGPITTSKAPVTMGIGSSRGGGALGGTTTQPADGTDATATFGNLTISAPGLAYTLAASSGTLTGTTSTPFDIQDQAAACSPNLDCPVSDGTSNHNKADIVATASTGSGELVESVFPNPPPKALCGTYSSVDPNTYESAYTPAPLSADRGEIITTTFAPIKKLSGNIEQVLKGQQICFGDANTFVTASGASATPTTLPDGKAGFVGLLQTCSGSTVGPCHDRKSDTTVPDASSPTGYDIVLVADVPVGWANDPMHG